MDAAVSVMRDAEGRREDLDLLRAGVVLGLVFYHTAYLFPIGLSFDAGPVSLAMTAFVLFTQLWGMPLLFVVAGSGVWYSLGVRGTGRFVRERLSRLLVPLVVGMLLIVPPQIYFSLRADHQDPGPYLDFLGRFFDLRLVANFPAFLRGDDPQGLFHLAHLWFLYYLLIWTLILLPVFQRLRGGAGRRYLDWLADRCQGPLGVVPLALPVALLEAIFGTWQVGGWNDYAYLVFLLYGFLLAADRRLRAAVRLRWRQSLAVGLGLLPVLLVAGVTEIGNPGRSVGVDHDAVSVAWRFLKATAGWSLTAGVLGLAPLLVSRIRRREVAPPRGGGLSADAAGRYAREAVLPFYVLHQTPIVILGYFVLQWQSPMLVKYLVVSVAALAVTLVLYDLLIRRANPTRVLLGMPRR